MNSPRSIEQILSQGYTVDSGAFLQQGLKIFQRHGGQFVGFTVILGIVSLVISYIPLIGNFAFLITVPLSAGFFIAAFRIIRGHALAFSDFFQGFNYFVPLVLASLVIGLFSLVVAVPAIVPSVIAIASAVSRGNEDIFTLAALATYPLFLVGVLVLLTAIMAIRLVYLFAF